MTDKKGRSIEAVYAITWDSAYCIYTVDASGDFVYTTFTWCGKFAPMRRNKLYCRADGSFYIKKYGHRLNLTDFIRTNY